jgi:hypothetical protein
MYKHKRFLLVAAMLVLSFMMPDFASANLLTQASLRLGRLGINAGSGGASDKNDLLVTFKLRDTPTSVAKITVTFPTGFTLTGGTPTVGTTGFPNTPTGITAPPGTLTAVVTSAGANAGGTIVVSGLTSASLNSTSLYGFTIPAGSITNPGTAAQYNPTVESDPASGPAIDTTITPTYITGATANKDQIAVSEAVAPNFTFQLSGTSDTLPNVDSTTIATSPGVTMTVGTNSPLGYTAYVKSANGSLVSATSPTTPITTGTFDGTPDTLAAGTTKYGFFPSTGSACSSCSGTLTYDGEYNIGSADTTHAGAFNGTNFASFVSRSGYTNADQINLKERVTVANTIGYANDYSDTLTIVAAGNF